MASTTTLTAPSLLASKKPWDARLAGPVPHDATYYAKCFMSGIVACGTTHTAMTPLDVTKCSMQVNPAKYTGLGQGLRTIIAEEGSRALFKGWAPTAIGYGAQGAFKFGLYEYFKDAYSNLVGEEYAHKYKQLIWCAGSASAEFFADLALCPMEMTKVKVQTSAFGTFPTALGPALSTMISNRADTRFPYGSLGPLWARQIPYNVSKFFFFEQIVSGFYTYLLTKPKDSYSKTTQLGVTFASGYLAGVVCAIVSHPADSIVSLMSKPDNKGKSVGQIARETGARRLLTGGLGTRVLMIGTLTGMQWWIYDSLKTAMGMGTTGGASPVK
ncbi:putative mitochondrial carrier family [Fimicolochytrium jonesii]|uniref:putative mitochondrial carrier family n=1 Tax=Fimicolochytrium jonesii TaxID=1396493 RepID=UPI0022FE59C9|nr:putative mitochondrial carrier family [Fimicolochytrium jonesii]KAI8823718.1 putative mitochondrial carrier family [Fimicolochytrium jonesii]